MIRINAAGAFEVVAIEATYSLEEFCVIAAKLWSTAAIRWALIEESKRRGWVAIVARLWEENGTPRIDSAGIRGGK